MRESGGDRMTSSEIVICLRVEVQFVSVSEK